VADENVDQQVVAALRTAGHDVWSVAEQEPGLSDHDVHDVLERARADGAVLVTADKDFGELVFRLRLVPGGVLLIRLAGLAPDQKAKMVTDLVRDHADELSGMSAVLARTSLRLRGLPGD
jgi:predicted nuclease of predicted toxin-antitoxin system